MRTCLLGLTILSASLRPASPQDGKREPGPRILPVAYRGLRDLHVHLLLPAGSSLDDPRRPGTAFLTARVLMRGETISLSAGEVEEAMASHRMKMDFWVDREFLHGSISMSPRNLYSGIRLLTDVVFNPSLNGNLLPADLLETHAGGLYLNPRDTLQSFFFLDDRFSRPVNALARAIGTVAMEDIRRHHQERFVPEDMVIAFAGPSEPAQVIKEFKDALYGFARKNAGGKPIARFKPSAALSLTLHETKPGRCEVHAGFVDPGPDVEGWDGWIEAVYGSEERLQRYLEEERVPVPNEPWLRASYLAGGRLLFEVFLEVGSSDAGRAAAAIRQSVSRVLQEAHDGNTAGSAAGPRARVAGIRDVLMRHSIDAAYGRESGISDAWVSASRKATRRAWASVLAPRDE